ncbi:CCN family member 2-like [Tenrec ecaudatus]|uniref:CCN family member 2-like n=1 Tax=Tenrec ecaudatus TaxID=94439 RepID=UPI003F59E672
MVCQSWEWVVVLDSIWVSQPLTTTSLQRDTAEICSGLCQCADLKASSCPIGVNLVQDGCGCCPMCAKQLGDFCTKRDVCDVRKNLYCSFEAPTSGRIGVCRAKEGASCYVEGKEHTDGETFQRGCRGMCTCRSGEVSCEPLCPPPTSLPRPDCPFLRLVKIPGKCCQEWVCDESKNLTMNGSALEDFMCFVLMAYQLEEAVTRNPRMMQRNCQLQTTRWSACSKTCGFGLSTRYSNGNVECRMEQQTRVCFNRSCKSQLEEEIKEGERCIHEIKVPYPLKLLTDGCVSVKSYRIKICGVCNDGRCCTPELTTPHTVEFRCLDGEVLEKNIKFIKTCKCHYNCRQ